MRILLVEDEKELSKSMITYLQRESYTCDVAYMFKEGIVIITFNRPKHSHNMTGGFCFTV